MDNGLFRDLTKLCFYILMVGIVLIAIYSVLAEEDDTHIISESAIYIEGQACIINMPTEKSTEKALLEFLECTNLHEKYQEKTANDN